MVLNTFIVLLSLQKGLFILLLRHHLKDFPANPHFLPDTKYEGHIRVSTECRQKRKGFLFGCYFGGYNTILPLYL